MQYPLPNIEIPPSDFSSMYLMWDARGYSICYRDGDAWKAAYILRGEEPLRPEDTFLELQEVKNEGVEVPVLVAELRR